MKHKFKSLARGAAIASVLTAAATLGLTGTANAAYSAPPASTTDWFGLDLINNPASAGGRQFQVCNYQSTANTVYVAVADETYAGARVLLQDDTTGWQTYGAYINFNPGGCEGFYIPTAPMGDTLQGYIKTPNFYGTGYVRYN